MRPLNLDRTFSEEEAQERCPELAARTARMATMLSGWGWGTIETTYKYGKPGTGSAHAWVTAERGDHGVTIEYQFRLNSRKGPTVTLLGGFWDGGPFSNETQLKQLAKPLRMDYTPSRRIQPERNKTMATPSMINETKPRPSKRVAKKATEPTPAKRAATRKRAAAQPEPEVTEEAPKRGRRRGRGPWADDADRRAAVVKLRNEGTAWADIAEEVGVTAGMANFLYNSDAYGEEFHGQATAEIVAEERDVNGMSWSEIEAKYWITRGQAWDLYAEAGGDHFKSDIGKGGRYVERDPEVVEARRAEKAAERAANKPATTRRRKKAFTGFDDETPEDDIINLVDGKSLTWRKTRGEGEDSAKVKPESADIKSSRAGRALTFTDERGKARTILVNNITAIK